MYIRFLMYRYTLIEEEIYYNILKKKKKKRENRLNKYINIRILILFLIKFGKKLSKIYYTYIIKKWE